MNTPGLCTILRDTVGVLHDHSQGQMIGVGLRPALAGSLTINGVANVDGSAAAWVIAPGATGVSLPPGHSGGLCNRVSYVYSNAADSAKAWASWIPL